MLNIFEKQYLTQHPVLENYQTHTQNLILGLNLLNRSIIRSLRNANNFYDEERENRCRVKMLNYEMWKT